MAGGDEMLGLRGAAGVGAALLFMGAGTNVYDSFSAVMSSPWTTEKFTQSPEEERMAKEYVRHAMIISWIYAGGGAILASYSGGWKLGVWPLAGAGIVTVYMQWLYRRALRRGTNSGAGASSSNGQRPTGAPPAAWMSAYLRQAG